MKYQIKTEITIKGTKDQVWQVLTDFDAYAQWNPFIKKVEGQVALGNRISVELGGMHFKPLVKRLEQGKAFEWLGHLWIKGIFDGRHKFEIIERNAHEVTFIHSEDFSGVLVGLIKKKLENETKKDFIKMNMALKKRVEAL